MRGHQEFCVSAVVCVKLLRLSKSLSFSRSSYELSMSWLFMMRVLFRPTRLADSCTIQTFAIPPYKKMLNLGGRNA
jgi:hypothetical protein